MGSKFNKRPKKRMTLSNLLSSKKNHTIKTDIDIPWPAHDKKNGALFREQNMKPIELIPSRRVGKLTPLHAFHSLPRTVPTK